MYIFTQPRTDRGLEIHCPQNRQSIEDKTHQKEESIHTDPAKLFSLQAAKAYDTRRILA